MFNKNSTILASCFDVAMSRICSSSIFVTAISVSIAFLFTAFVITISLAFTSKFEVAGN